MGNTPAAAVVEHRLSRGLDARTVQWPVRDFTRREVYRHGRE
jgi:hypothetical protein